MFFYGERELLASKTTPRILVRMAGKLFKGEPLHCNLGFDRWIIDLSIADGLEWWYASDYPLRPLYALILGHKSLCWVPPDGLHVSLARWLAWSLGVPMRSPPLTCVTMVTRMLGLPLWPRRPAHLERMLSWDCSDDRGCLSSRKRKNQTSKRSRRRGPRLPLGS